MMCAAATPDTSRHHDNVFEEYSNDLENSSLIDKEKATISDSFREALDKSTESLFRKLESNEKHFENSRDSSIYTGTSGIAYLYHNYGYTFNDRTYIESAIEVLQKNASKLMISETLTMSPSFLCGSAGPLALSGVFEYRYFDRRKSVFEKLSSLWRNAGDRSKDFPDELLYGKAGYLYSLLFVNRNISPPPFEDSFLKKVILSILESGQATSVKTRSESPLIYSWHDKLYLGGAHGLSGILFVLLQALPCLTQYQLKEQIEPALRYLMKIRFASGNFPSSVGNDSDKLVHWCHGAPSMTMLFCKAYEVFENPEYLQVAIECGEVVWSRGLLKKGYGLCHGVAGNAYTFLYLFQSTKDIKHLYRACKFAEWCMDYGIHESRAPDRPFSLFEGLAGTIYFLIDMQNPLSAKFPGFSV